jgi:hypothetical protein
LFRARKSFAWIATAGALAALVLLAACGDDDDDTSGDDGGEPTASEDADTTPGSSIIEACVLLTEAELAPLLGEVGDDGVPGGNATDIFSCTWRGTDGDFDSQLTLQIATNTTAEENIQGFQGREGVEEVDEVGDEALVELGAPNEDSDFVLNTIVSRSGDTFITLSSGSTVQGDEATDALANAMRSVIAGLPE